jgi:hypothetical protein
MSTLTYEGALGLFYPTVVWKSQGRNVYSEIQWISGAAIPAQSQLDSDIAAYDFNGGIVSQFLTGVVPQMTGTATTPFDNTVPLATEGFQVWNRTVSVSTPGILLVARCAFTVDHSVNTRYITAAMFANNTCIGTASVHIATAGRPAVIALDVSHAPASVGNIVFQLRIGASGSGTTHVNQSNAGTLGGSMASNYSIMELQQ